ncbi:hypothetical protein ACJA23_02855 [Mycoplasma corogypsi]|uniref:hypothetical protein n=1 Tax=Mycoplasma corogypsi TaxID=2106 RepID=UPI00387324FF
MRLSQNSDYNYKNISIYKMAYTFLTGDSLLFSENSMLQISLYVNFLLGLNPQSSYLINFFNELLNTDFTDLTRLKAILNKTIEPEVQPEKLGISWSLVKNIPKQKIGMLKVNSIYYWMYKFLKAKNLSAKTVKFAARHVLKTGLLLKEFNLEFNELFFKLFKYTKNQNKLSEIQQFITNLSESIIISSNLIGYKNKDYISTYLNNGLSGYLFLLVWYYKFVDKDEKVKQQLIEFCDYLLNFHSNKFNLSNGLLGIIAICYIISREFKLTKNYKILFQNIEHLLYVSYRIGIKNNANTQLDKNDNYFLKVLYKALRKYK